jgi:NAD+ synthase/NAD+ synthase (glutamine-hydrolysing)
MSALVVTLAQLNPTLGDIDGNLALMQEAALKAQQAGASLVVFSELSLTGYHPGDLLEEPAFLERIRRGLAAARQATLTTPGLCWVLGAPTERQGSGKPLENSLLVLQDGELRLSYGKQLLPTYGIFDDRRHFEPGPDVARVLAIGDARVGFLICEDGWNEDGRLYQTNPFQRLADAAPDLVVSINASPSNVGKREQRHALFTAACRRHGVPLLYVNQVGGHDSLIFDGASFAVSPDAGVVFEAERFAPDVCTLRLAGKSFVAEDGRPLPAVPAQGLPTLEFYRRQIGLGLRDYARRCGFARVVLGSSGGIDSALTLALAVEALGAEQVTAITMPSRFSSGGSVTDSVVLCRNLGCRLLEHPIAALVEGYQAGYHAATGDALRGVALENLQSRIRGTVLMEYSNQTGALLLTTGNKSEVSVGYCTLYGDTNGGLSLIGDLYKLEVFALSRHLNERAGRELIPAAILDKEPSAELAPGQRDSDSLPPYETLDAILEWLLEGEQLSGERRALVSERFGALERTKVGASQIARVKRLLARSEFKRRQAAPILRLRPRAFGTGRQMPIAAHYGEL